MLETRGILLERQRNGNNHNNSWSSLFSQAHFSLRCCWPHRQTTLMASAASRQSDWQVSATRLALLTCQSASI